MLSETEEEIRKELLKVMKQFQCPVCLNLMTDPLMTRCVHRFCGICINKAIDASSGDFCRCPLCNEKITKRSLRPQTEVSELILAFKAAVDAFETDIEMSVITDSDEVVVFDVSTDKSKTSLHFNESINDLSITSINDKTVDKTNDSLNTMSDIEANRKTTVITASSGDWPTALTDEDIEEMSVDIEDTNNATKDTNNTTKDTNNTTKDTNNETDIYFNTTKDSLNDTIDESLNEKSIQTHFECNSDVKAIPTQSQNLRVNKSKITYSSSRKPLNDKFDEIIGLSNHYMESKKAEKQTERADLKPKSKYISSDSESEVEEIEVKRRKPLSPLKNTRDLIQKKKFKRIQNLVSSDDDFSSPLVVNTKKRVLQIKDSDVFESESKNRLLYDSDEDQDLPPKNNKSNSFEFKRNNDLNRNESRSESRSGYNSDHQLITSSPLSSDF